MIVNVPAAFDVVEQRGAAGGVGGGFLGVGLEMRAEHRDFLRGLLVLFAAGRGRDAVRANESVMVLLRAEQRLAIAIGADDFCTGGERAHDPEMNRAGIRLRIHVAPVDLAGLEFHQAFEAVDAAVKIMREGHLRRAAETEAERAFVHIAVRRDNASR